MSERHSKALDRWQRDIAFNLRALAQEQESRRREGKHIERRHAALMVECDVLRDVVAIVDAALALFPAPAVHHEQSGDAFFCPYCTGMGYGNPSDSHYRPVAHTDGCRAVAFVDALRPFRDKPDETYEEWWEENVIIDSDAD